MSPMKIMFVARHGPRDNADEDAIAHALRALGHEVECRDERDNPPRVVDVLRSGPAFLLTNKWDDLATLSLLPCPKVFWFFDLIKSDDWELTARSAERERWVREMTEACQLGFLTDGDWVAADTTGKLNWLMQGADERVIGPWGVKTTNETMYPGETRKPSPETWGRNWTGDILFTGSTIHGGVRQSFVEEMAATYGDRFLAFGHKARDRVHGRRLAELIAAAKVVVAPDGPVTHQYWSNRAYLTMGFGGLLLHPWCEGLKRQGYEQGRHLFYYRDRPHLHALLRDLLEDDGGVGRRLVATTGFKFTRDQHTYRHRCADLVRTVKAKLRLK